MALTLVRVRVAAGDERLRRPSAWLKPAPLSCARPFEALNNHFCNSLLGEEGRPSGQISALGIETIELPEQIIRVGCLELEFGVLRFAELWIRSKSYKSKGMIRRFI